MNALIGERARAVDKLRALLSQAEDAGRVLDAGELEEFETLKACIAGIDEQLFTEIPMQTDAPEGALRPLTPTPSRLSEGLPSGDLAQLVERSGRVSFEVKTSLRTLSRNLVSITLPSPAVALTPPALYRPPESGYLSLLPRLLDLLPSVAVNGTAVMQHLLTYVGTPPNYTGLKAAEVAEGAAKPESDVAVTSTTITFKTFAHWLSVTRQALSDIPSLRQLLDDVLTEGLLDRVDAYAYSALAAAATPYTPVAASNVIDNSVLAISRLQAQGGRDVVSLVNPADLAAAAIQKAAGSGNYLGRPEIPGRILPCAAIPAGTLLAFSREAGYWASRETVSVLMGVANDDFIKNVVRILVEMRGAVVLSRPNFMLVGGASALTAPISAQAATPASAPHAGAPRRS